MGQIKNIKLHIVTDIKNEHMSLGRSLLWRKSKVNTGKSLYREPKKGAARPNARELVVTIEKAPQISPTRTLRHQVETLTHTKTNTRQVTMRMLQTLTKRNRRMSTTTAQGATMWST